MRNRIASGLLAALVLALAGAGCGEKGEPEEDPDGVELTVMSFNVWYGGASVDVNSVGEAIRAADADVVGVQEPEANLAELARVSGMPHYEPSLHLLSRYPILPAERNGIPFAYLEVEPDRVVAIANGHLLCCPYGPNLAAKGKTAEQVEAVESRLRMPEAQRYGRALASLADDGVPTFMTGDFNSPSHLDWTADAVAARDLPYELDWPASQALADAGLRDTYREAHPDPAADPGITWTPGTPPPHVRPDETLDRIDWVLAAGPVETLESALVGEPGGEGVDVAVDPWGSDHRAVASTTVVEPAPAPYLVAADPRVVTAGERVTIPYTLGGRGGGREVGIFAPDGRRPEGLETIPIFDGADHLAPRLGTAGLDPGRYRVAMTAADGSVLADAPLWIQAADAQPEIETTAPVYAPGDPIDVRWRDGPGNKLDWIGVFDAADPSRYDYLGFVYAGARPEGSLTLTRADIGKLDPGRYEVALMLDDGYSVIAADGFEVR